MTRSAAPPAATKNVTAHVRAPSRNRDTAVEEASTARRSSANPRISLSVGGGIPRSDIRTNMRSERERQRSSRVFMVVAFSPVRATRGRGAISARCVQTLARSGRDCMAGRLTVRVRTLVPSGRDCDTRHVASRRPNSCSVRQRFLGSFDVMRASGGPNAYSVRQRFRAARRPSERLLRSAEILSPYCISPNAYSVRHRS